MTGYLSSNVPRRCTKPCPPQTLYAYSHVQDISTHSAIPFQPHSVIQAPCLSCAPPKSLPNAIYGFAYEQAQCSMRTPLPTPCSNVQVEEFHPKPSSSRSSHRSHAISPFLPITSWISTADLPARRKDACYHPALHRSLPPCSHGRGRHRASRPPPCASYSILG